MRAENYITWYYINILISIHGITTAYFPGARSSLIRKTKLFSDFDSHKPFLAKKGNHQIELMRSKDAVCMYFE